MATTTTLPPRQFPSWEQASQAGIQVHHTTGATKADDDGTPLYLWQAGEDEHRLITQILGTELQAPDTWVVAPPYTCTGCGRLSGFADSVHTALMEGVHSREFLVEATLRPRPNSAPRRFVK